MKFSVTTRKSLSMTSMVLQVLTEWAVPEPADIPTLSMISSISSVEWVAADSATSLKAFLAVDLAAQDVLPAAATMVQVFAMIFTLISRKLFMAARKILPTAVMNSVPIAMVLVASQDLQEKPVLHVTGAVRSADPRLSLSFSRLVLHVMGWELSSIIRAMVAMEAESIQRRRL